MNLVVDPISGTVGILIVIIGLFIFVIMSDHNNKGDGGRAA